MDPKEVYKLMSQRFYDPDNNTTFIPEKLSKYFDKLGKPHFKSHYQYSNLEEFFETTINVMLDPRSKRGNEKEKFILKLEDKSSIVFYLDSRGGCFDNVDFFVKKKNSNGICVFFEWYPFLNFIYINNLFYDTGDKKKLDPNKDCEVFNIPEKSGEFFLNLIEDISKRFGVKKIVLQDASTINYGGNKVNLALFYLQNNGKTYYGKFGFCPIKLKEPNSKILYDIAYGFGFDKASSDLNYVRSKLKRIPKLTPKNMIDWIKKTNELRVYFPEFYLKKIS